MATRLPGLYFRTITPPSADILPRMDIAAFVGLAASGPLHIPVLVEDPAQFRDIFGDDLTLAFDTTRGEPLRSHLGAAVEAFFHNGGRRCWVVRVAEDPAVNMFPIPTLLNAETHSPIQVAARSGGAWSDTLRCGAVVHPFTIPLEAITLSPGATTLMLNVPPQTIHPYDLLELRAPASDGSTLVAYCFAENIHSNATSQTITSPQTHWFRQGAWSDATATFGLPTAAVWHHPDGERQLWDGSGSATLTFEGDVLTFTCPLPSDALPQRLHIVRLDGSQATVLAIVDDVVIDRADNMLMLVASRFFWPLDEYDALPLNSAWGNTVQPLVSRLRFTLHAWRHDGIVGRVSNLGFHPDHTRYWGHLPTDDALFAWPTGEPIARTPTPLDTDAQEPRFAFAGAPPHVPALPLGMALAPAATETLPRSVPASEPDTLTRDGLAAFDATRLFDPDMVTHATARLLVEAEQRFYLQAPPPTRPFAPLLGLHSLLPIGEATLIAMPDAVQPGWEQTTIPPPAVPLAPKRPTLEPLETPGYYRLHWPAVDGATGYVVEESDTPLFERITHQATLNETEMERYLAPDCPVRRFYRLRTLAENATSPWSRTLAADLPRQPFAACTPPTLPEATPRLVWPTVADGTYRIEWDAVPDATTYELQEADEPLFLTPTTLSNSDTTGMSLPHRPTQTLFYRVRAYNDTSSGLWSATIVVQADAIDRWHAKMPSSDGLLAAQRALLRFCAARGDLFAALSLPRGTRATEAETHAARLQSATDAATFGVAPIGFDEATTLSFGTLVHPWLWQQHDTAVHLHPPDGVALGVLAETALRDGAWRSPANRPWRTVVALEPTFSHAEWQQLYPAAVNLVHRDARGFLTLSNETLFTGDELRAIHVRRLLSLIRKVALREGEEYVFEPNTPGVRRRVQHRFEQLLSHLHRRGAFRGTHASDAYRVITDGRLNTQQSIEAGRFVIELRVAPAAATAVIIVRLMQHDRRTTITEEV
nr:hypothetical protein [Ardenticatena sp.]